MSAAPLAGIGLGSNVGDAVGTVERALVELGAIGVVRERSSLYRTAAWGVKEQDDFINAAALLETALAPRDLLHALKALEARLGRIVTYRWGPRVIDLDILTYDDARVDEPDLTIPHERLRERAFALAPLAEIEPAWRDAYEALPEAARAEAVRLPFAIRALRVDDPADVRAVAVLFERVASEGVWLATQAPVDVDELAARIARRAAERGTLVAVERSRVIGEASLATSSDARQAGVGVLGMAVARDARGRGVGRALLERTIASARARGMRRIDLEVFPHNAAALALYERCGFVRTALRSRAYPRANGEVWDAIAMSFSLDADVTREGTSPSTS